MKSYRNFGWSLFVMLLIVSGAWATTYNVPGDYGTIQAAINAATDGDIINVAAGTYVENLIIAKDLTVQGAGVGVTIIDANASPGRGIESEPANFAPGWDIVLEDFTLIGPTQTGGNGYGIKLAGDIATAIITDVEVYGSAKSGVDLNGLASGTITNLYSHDNLNRGLQLTDCDNITINGLTTSGNPWGGAVVATKGAAFTGGSDGVTFTGALSLAETTPILSERNAPSYPAITNLAVPTAPFDYLVGTTANVYVQGYYTDASAALGWGAGAWAKNRVNGHFEVIPGLTIQAAINAASAGDIIDVAAGTYAENIDVNKRVEIIGAGATTVITQNPAGAGSSQVGVVQLTASGISGDPILLKDLRIEPQGMAGISVGLFTLATGQTVEYVSLDNVDVIGTATDFTTEQERGLYVDNSSTLRYLDVVDCQFNDLMYGWYFHKVANAVDASTVQWVTVSTTTFNHNTQKGVYAEKLADASFTQCTIDNNGFNSAPLPSWFAPWSCGVDLNLKNGSYSNFLFDDCDVTNNAHDEAKEGVGLAVKGRGTGNDPSYVAYPAYVDNVDITNCTISDNERGLRFGEPGKANTTPTNVYVYHNTFCNNTQNYSGFDGSAYGDLVNQTTVAIDAEENYWCTVDPGQVAAKIANASTGSVDFSPWCNSDFTICTYVMPVHNVTQNTYHVTIGDAITAAVNGDVIECEALTFNENVTLNKSLTLRGAQWGVDACGRVASETIITGAGALLTLVTGSAGSVIDGFTFSGGANSITSSSGPLNDVEILNNRMVGFTSGGLFMNDSGIDMTVHQNYVDGSSQAGGGGIVHFDTDNFDGLHFTSNCVQNSAGGTGFFVDGNHNIGASIARAPLFSDNYIADNNTGTNLGTRAFEYGEISLNTFYSNNFDGLQGGIQHTSITRNTFTGNGRYGLALTSFGNTGADRGGQFSTITENVFSGNVTSDLFFSATQAALTISTNSASNNSFGSATAALYSGTELINCSGNWWGSNTLAGVDGAISATTVDFTPWLHSGTDTDGGTAGFQGDFTTLNVDDDSPQSGVVTRIQEGIDMVSGSTVYVWPGTYFEGITSINSTLVLEAADHLNPPTIKPTASTAGIGSQDPTAGWYIVDPGVSANFLYLNFDGDAPNFNIGQVIHHQGPGLISHCSFTNVEWALNYGIGIVSRGAYAFEVANCNFSNIERIGAHFNHYTASPKLYHDNTFVGKGAGLSINYACEAEREANVLANNNVISNCTGVAGDGSTSAAFLATTYFGGTNPTTLEAHNNLLNNNFAGFAIGYDGSDVTVVVATENNLEGCDYGVTSLSTVLAEAILNWWGDVDGPDPILLLSAPGRPQPMDAESRGNQRGLDEGVDGLIHYSPWIASSGIDDDIAAGWQPDKSILAVSMNGTIQEGIDNVSGSTVIVTPGTYEEQLHITLDDLNLVGAGIGSAILQSPVSLPLFYTTSANNYPVIFVDGADDVAISGMTVDGLGRGNTNYRFQGIAYWNSSGSITDVRVTGVRETPLTGTQHGVGIYAFNNLAGPFTLDVTDVIVDDYQKNAFALNGNDNLTADLLRVTTTGAGATGVTAQNGIQIWGGDGTVNDCDVTGNAYSGGGWSAAGYLFIEGTVTVSGGCTSTDNQVGYNYLDASGSIAGGSIAGTAGAPAYSSGVDVTNYTAGVSGTHPSPQPMYEEHKLDQDTPRLDAPGDEVVSIAGVTMIGANAANSYGVYAYNANDNLDLTVDGCTIELWENGVVVQQDGGTIAPAVITDNRFTNTNNAWDNTAGHLYDNNCWSDFGTNSGFPTQYDVTGGGGNADLNPNPNTCGDVNLTVSSADMGCTGACATGTLYLTLDAAGLPNLQVVLQMPAGFTATNGIVTPGVNVDPNLIQAYASTSGSQLTVDMGFMNTGSTGGGVVYVAAIPIQSAGVPTGTYTFSGISSLWIGGMGQQHVNEVVIGSVDVTVDCDEPVYTAGVVAPWCEAVNEGADFVGQYPFTVQDLGDNSVISEVKVIVGTANVILNPGTTPANYPTFPDLAQANTLYGGMSTDGCYDMTIIVTDAECNDDTVTIDDAIIKDTTPATYTTETNSDPLYVYNNTTGPTLLDDKIDVCWTLFSGVCEANAGELFVGPSASGPWTSLEALTLGLDCYLESDAEAAAVWAWIMGIDNSFNNEAFSFWFEVVDCAGNAAVSTQFTIWIDNSTPANTVDAFDARPAHLGVWLDWSWTASAAEAVEMRVYRSPLSGEYPGYAGDLWSNLANYENTFPPAVGWTLVATQTAVSGTITSATYASNNNRGDFADHSTYWLDAEGTWVDGDGNSSAYRDIYRYVTFVKDAGGNWSSGAAIVIGDNADRSTNYWLGDFSTADAAGLPSSRGRVDSEDLGLLSAVYFTSPGAHYANIGPVNPVENGSIGKGIPNPDGSINFQDLVPFSFNYGTVSPVGIFGSEFKLDPNPADLRSLARLDDAPVVELIRSTEGAMAEGEEFTVTVSVMGNESNVIKAAEATLEFDPEVFEFISAAPAQSTVDENAVLFSKAALIGGEPGKVGMVAAACGNISTLHGDFTLATVTFRVLTIDVLASHITLSDVVMLDNTGEIGETPGGALGFGSSSFIPNEYALHQNYPNPFNPTTTIQYDLREAGLVKIQIFNVLGQNVATLVNTEMPAGRHIVNFDATNLTSGLYIYTIQVNNFSERKKMMLMR